MKFFARLIIPAICVGIGWALGATYRAPPIVIETTDRMVVATKEKISSALQTRTEVKEEVEPTEEAPIVLAASAPGEVAPAPITEDEIILPANGLAPFIRLCKMKNISNAPNVDSHGHVVTYRQMIDVEGVTMAMMPVRDACISSGFGRRRSKMHKGIDYYSKTGGMIFAAADGQIIEAEYRDDYGFTVLLNHGNGYFTRYAHLAGFSEGVKVGAAVPLGFALGEMGRTAGYNIPKHLHFELLRGDYDNPKKSFGLEPVDIHSL